MSNIEGHWNYLCYCLHCCQHHCYCYHQQHLMMPWKGFVAKACLGTTALMVLWPHSPLKEPPLQPASLTPASCICAFALVLTPMKGPPCGNTLVPFKGQPHHPAAISGPSIWLLPPPNPHLTDSLLSLSAVTQHFWGYHQSSPLHASHPSKS